jgi:hypothetical protein
MNLSYLIANVVMGYFTQRALCGPPGQKMLMWGGCLLLSSFQSSKVLSLPCLRSMCKSTTCSHPPTSTLFLRLQCTHRLKKSRRPSRGCLPSAVCSFKTHRKSKSVHPDKTNTGSDAFIELSRAKETLTDPLQRGCYDRYGQVLCANAEVQQLYRESSGVIIAHVAFPVCC